MATKRIINPVLFWNGVEQPDIKSVEYNVGYNKELINVLSEDGKRVLKQQTVPNYSGTMTVAVSQDGTATDWEALADSMDEGTLVVQKTASRRLMFLGVSIGEISSGDSGRELSVPWSAIDYKKVG